MGCLGLDSFAADLVEKKRVPQTQTQTQTSERLRVVRASESSEWRVPQIRKSVKEI